MSHSDGIWPAAGSAQLRNLSNQATGMNIGHYSGVNPGGSGTRAVEVLHNYQTSASEAVAPAAGADLSDQ